MDSGYEERALAREEERGDALLATGRARAEGAAERAVGIHAVTFMGKKLECTRKDEEGGKEEQEEPEAG
ncbi:hypothetical protein KM043_014985 [Ampulex compressa]|nr:hypothetical protein KM043_014985 [Ampulex compressa]